ncbi:SCO family protein [Sphingomonas sp. ID0503]|uniref:SCO family protein n=1 Tax=Sphingomonas sp. ID0503 TaxID=3399691 RepID=UPI003AFAAB35
MAGSAMNAALLFKTLAFAATLALASCGQQANTAAEAPLAGARLGGPFTLTDQDGRTVTQKAFAGRYVLIYFGYTFCPDVCPLGLQTLSQGLAAFEKSAPDRAAEVQPVFVTVDPERDTPAVMKQYVAAFHPRLIGLTGTPQQIAAVAKEYAVFYKKVTQEGATGYLMDHSSAAMLFGPDGKPIALVPQDLKPADVAKVLDQWVR